MKLRIGCVVVGFLSLVFSMAAQTTANPNAASPATSSDVTTTGGTANKIPMFTTATNIQNSIVTQTGTTGVSVAGKLTATGVISGSRFEIGSNLFAFGTYSDTNAFLGFAGNTTSTGNANTASGVQALYSDTTGFVNTANGSAALYSNTTGDYNTAVGASALYANSDGSFNTATGSGALIQNTEGSYNDAFGYQALNSNTLGSYNAAFGYQALYSNTGDSALELGVYNTAVGYQALYSNTSGAFNTAVGEEALYSDTTGSLLTCIGWDCTASDGITNATAIGAHAVVGQSNSLVLGGTGQYAVKVGIGTETPSNVLTIARGAGHPVSDSWETYSSRRWKTNVHPLQNALNKVELLRGVSYDQKDSGKHEIGVIAEDVGKVVPEIVTYEDNGRDARAVDYSRLTALLIEAVKQQQREIRDLKSELRATRQTLQQVKAQVAAAQPALIATK